MISALGSWTASGQLITHGLETWEILRMCCQEMIVEVCWALRIMITEKALISKDTFNERIQPQSAKVPGFQGGGQLTDTVCTNFGREKVFQLRHVEGPRSNNVQHHACDLHSRLRQGNTNMATVMLFGGGHTATLVIQETNCLEEVQGGGAQGP